ncbi:MAG TPA: arginase family protein [Candidatus Baltobacteraceae bacterium]|nr:arginase family protein [Candidatus Baltobacteraceae bacterium]
MAVKIVRQPNKIALVGAPTSAAAMSLGHEGAPTALRAAGLIDRLRSIGYDVTDLGDDPPQKFKQDDESPRARNIAGVLASLESLKPRVEQAVKSAALPLILTGDCSPVLATVAGLRRYFRHVSLIYMDRDADLLTPATTSSGCLDGMVISHAAGRGAAELVRFWGEPPLVREPDIALFGVDRIEPAEEEVLRTSPVRRYMADEVRRMGPAAAAQAAVDRIQGKGYECVLHLDVDVIADFQATNNPGTGGLSLEEAREALEIFVRQKHVAAIEVAAYNPLKDADGKGAALIIDLLAGVLEKRLKALQEETPLTPGKSSGADHSSSEEPAKSEPSPAIAPGEAWSSDDLDAPSETESPDRQESEAHSANPGDTGDPPA